MIIFDRVNKKGDLLTLTLKTGGYYTITFDQSIDKFSMPSQGVFTISGTDKKAAILSLTRNNENFMHTDVQILIPEDNPFPILIAVYAISLLVAGIAIKLGTSNIVKITEDVTKPSPWAIIGLGIIAFIYIKSKR
jgi:hypothetical protein